MLEKFTCKKTYLGKSEMCSGNKYMVTITRKGVAWVKFVFHDNFENSSNLNDFLYCLLLDGWSYENAKELENFALEFGYSIESAKKPFEACRKQWSRMHKLMSNEEIRELDNELRELGY